MKLIAEHAALADRTSLDEVYVWYVILCELRFRTLSSNNNLF